MDDADTLINKEPVDFLTPESDADQSVVSFSAKAQRDKFLGTSSITKKIQSDHHPDIVDAGKGVKRLERLGLAEKLIDSETRRDLFGNASNEQYKKMLGYVNSITRGNRIDYEYKDGQTPLMVTPPLEDKGSLMDMTFETVREILKNDQMDSLTALRRAGMTLAGAINYIHPYEDGNGRTARTLHYLVEFGNERGESAFEADLHAIIGKLALYDVDRAKALDDTPPPELEGELNKYVSQNSGGKNLGEREFASKRVEAFLKMMAGKINIPIDSEITLRNFSLLRTDQPMQPEKWPPGSLNGVDLYTKSYLYQSSIPNRAPNDIPEGASRLIGERENPDIPKIVLNIDLL